MVLYSVVTCVFIYILKPTGRFYMLLIFTHALWIHYCTELNLPNLCVIPDFHVNKIGTYYRKNVPVLSMLDTALWIFATYILVTSSFVSDQTHFFSRVDVILCVQTGRLKNKQVDCKNDLIGRRLGRICVLMCRLI